LSCVNKFSLINLLAQYLNWGKKPWRTLAILDHNVFSIFFEDAAQKFDLFVQCG